jgi:ATP-dependent Clp protease adaptor protein ClpS
MKTFGASAAPPLVRGAGQCDIASIMTLSAVSRAPEGPAAYGLAVAALDVAAPDGPAQIVHAGDDDAPKGPGGGNGDGDDQVGIATKTRTRPKKPSMFKVLMLNDDYTPMEFVVMVLKRFFHMDLEQATRVMLHVHQKGVGVCGIFPYEIAETKVNQVMDFALQNQHPLQCTLEKA